MTVVGVHPTSTDVSMPVVELARACEARGLGSLSFPEHTHIPVDSPATSDRYQRTLDPFVASSFVAATTGLQVGTAISLVGQHDAIALAKEIATIDHLSNGRFTLGVGFGYNRKEAADHGVPVAERALYAEETVRLMRALWTDDQAEFEGRFLRVSRSYAWPKPARPGGVPVLLGVRASERNFQRIVEWADGWIPMGNGITRSELAPDLADLRTRWDDAGRASEPAVCCFFAAGSAAEMAREVERAIELGVGRAEVYLEDRARDDVLPILDELGTVVAQLAVTTT